tara:strand:+ start:818 stop:1162 length:345 start_codon:yes stop_codon:yes gene_type:complete
MTDTTLRKSIQSILSYATTHDLNFNSARIGAIDRIVKVCKQYQEEGGFVEYDDIDKMENVIQELNLTPKLVLRLVKDWYTKGMYADILQDESGRDLEEIIERELDSIDNINKKQ